MDTTTHTSPTPTDEQGQIDGRPHTIPALKEWSAGATPYIFSADARIVFDRDAAQSLAPIAAVFAEDLQHLTGMQVPVVVAGEGRSGDVVLRLDNKLVLPDGAEDEGYLLEIGSRLTLRARAAAGVFYGTRTVLQLLRQDYTLPGGTASDWPDYPERSLMVDMGRKYFSISWLENHIRDLAYLKYNYCHFHLNDTYGFRLASERHPEITSSEHYTREQIRSLIELAQRYHITIVPEIDMPGHLDPVLAVHPELQLVSSDGRRKVSDIDLANDASYDLMRDLLDEFIPLFPGPYWHIGADEYIMKDDYACFPQLHAYARQHYGPQANAKDTYLGFVNWANEIVKSHGKITRAWNDGLYGGAAVSVANDIVYEHWLRSGLEPQEIVDRDLYIMNGNADQLYYVLGNTPNHAWRALPDVIYSTFENHIFHGATTIENLHPKNLGAKLHVWCDNPTLETENEIAEGIECSLRSLAQKNWGSTRLVADYDSFVEIIKKIGRAPGYAAPALTK